MTDKHLVLSAETVTEGKQQFYWIFNLTYNMSVKITKIFFAINNTLSEFHNLSNAVRSM